MNKVYIQSIGKHLPNKPISNDEIEDYLGLIHGKGSKIKERMLTQNGIRTRHYAMDINQNPTDTLAGMTSKAIADCISKIHLDVNAISLLTAGTTQADLPIPGFASQVHHASQIHHTCAIASHQSVCAAGMMAIQNAFLQVKQGIHTHAIACAGDMPSRFFRSKRFENQSYVIEKDSLSFDTEFLRWMLSDGAGAMYITDSPHSHQLSLEIEWIDVRSHAHAFEECMYAGKNKSNSEYANWMEYPTFSHADIDGAINLRQDLKLVNNIVSLGVQHLFDLINEGKFSLEEMKWLLCHYSSEYFKQPIIDLLAKGGVKIEDDKWFTNLHTKGNTGSASIFIMLEELLYSGRLGHGDTILCMVPESGQFITTFMMLKVHHPTSVSKNIATSFSEIKAPEIHIDNQPIQEKLVRELTSVWVDFETKLRRVPIIQRIYNETISLDDYKLLLLNLRQQVIDGSQWIARAASNVSMEYFDVRSSFITHSRDEHRDYQILEKNYINCGGSKEELYTGEKNIGSEALSAYMFHKASQPNPFDLLGGMFIIEGLGNRIAGRWGRAIQEILQLNDDQVSFFIYHETSDSNDNHFERLEKAINSPYLTEELAKRIVKTAKVVAHLYVMQLTELGHY